MSCSIEGCTKKVVARGKCWTHYRRELRHGDANAIMRKEAGTCSEEGCGNKLYGLGLCQKHFQRKKYAERLDQGLCVMCGKENDRETVYCAACGTRRSIYKKNARMKRKAGTRD
ncbi:hypothetical protein SAMN02799624_05245 [Paenibacillus sp. UNC496MF]|uniref:hypothetical protein n=1 Tax=Paenibacillus sp. UNC496MF TaxID=1502753 RepID=UPI0008EB61A7|nr:hypothetical protein [Paenibacillus sp. UNC496MF]SFJ62784.1 hypothetical protein SAMN02799624_05245 [Paenibacillus sp. UNC496MF]